MTESLDGVEQVLARGRLERPAGISLCGDWGGANLTRVCGWLAHELHERAAGSTPSTIRTGDAGAGNLHAVGHGEVDLAVVTPSAVATLAQRGAGPFADGGYPQLRALAELPHPDRLLFAIRAEFEVGSFAELRERQPGLRLATSLDVPDASFAGYAAQRLLEASGLGPDAIREWGGEVIVHNTPFECVAEVQSGAADAVFHEAVMTPWWHGLAAEVPLRFLSFEDDVLELAATDLACEEAVLPAGFMTGMDDPVRTPDFRGYLVVVREEMAPDLASLLTYVLAETWPFFVKMNYSHIPAERSPIHYPLETEAMRQTPIPLHPGALAYYEHAGEAAAVGTTEGTR